MKYAYIEAGKVTNVILWDGSDSWAPPPGVTMVNLDDASPVSIGYSYDGANFTPPAEVAAPAPSAAEILAANTFNQSQLLASASVAIAPLQMAVSLGEATDAETSLAKAWVAYSRQLKAVDLTAVMPVWPAPPSA